MGIGDFTLIMIIDVLLNVCKDISFAVNTWKTKYMEAGRRRGMPTNENVRIGSNSYEKLQNFTVNI